MEMMEISKNRVIFVHEMKVLTVNFTRQKVLPTHVQCVESYKTTQRDYFLLT